MRQKPGRIERVILVASGKGGVGKTTVAVNLALALVRKGRKVALLDADLYGPNIPLMLGIRRTSEATGWEQFVPILTSARQRSEAQIESVERFGLRVMSAGFLIADTQAVNVGSSLMVGKLMESLVHIVDWGDSDTMIIDLPPGSDEPTGTIIASTDVAGGVIVTTPQDIARLDAKREIKRFEEVSLPLLGLIENMSYFVCSHCGERQEVFHRGTVYEDLGAPLLGEVPLHPEISALADSGRPLLLENSDSPAKAAFIQVADELWRRLATP